MLGMNGGELLVIAVIALLVIGPERLPGYAAQLAKLVKELRKMAVGARDQVKTELGPEFEDLDWRKLDPRQYDPRRIVREALQDAWDDDEPYTPEPPDGDLKAAARPAGRPGGGASRPGDRTGPAVFDPEAT